MTKVSLDPYRSDGVLVFLGYSRGMKVAEDIKEEYGTDVSIVIPDDVLYICTHFKAGFHEVLSNVELCR